MNFKDSVDKYISFSEGEYYDDANDVNYGYEEEEEEEFESPAKQRSSAGKGFFDNIRARAKAMKKTAPEDMGGYEEDYDDYYEEKAAPSRSSSSANVVDFSSKSRSGNVKVILAKPSVFNSETVKNIARSVNKQCLVLLNLEMVSEPDMRRMIDFLSGVTFANDGKINCISNKTFVILPHNYDFSGDVLENLKNGFYSF